MNRDQEDQEQITLLRAEADLLLNGEHYSTDDETRVAEITTEITRLNGRIEQRAQILAASKNPVNVERGSDSGPELHSRIDPWGDTGSTRDRALAVIDHLEVPDTGKTKLDRLVRADDTATSEWAIAGSNPHYVSAFAKVLRDPISGRDGFDDDERRAFARASEVRAAMSLTGANGGYMVPTHLDPSIVLVNDGATNPFRRIARVETIGTSVWHGVTSAGVTAEWASEAAEMSDASPTVSQPTITPVRANAYVQASFEVTQDSNLAEQITAVFSDAKNNLEAAAFAVGTGSTQPWGVVTRLQATTASRVSATTNASFGLVDVYALNNALPARYRQNASWLGEQSVLNTVRRFNEGDTGNSSFWTDLGGGTPPSLLGRNVYESSEMYAMPLHTATSSNDDVLIFGDFSRFVIVDRIGMEIVYDPIVKGASRRPTGEVGWAAFWRVGSDVIDTNAFRVLVV